MALSRSPDAGNGRFRLMLAAAHRRRDNTAESYVAEQSAIHDFLNKPAEVGSNRVDEASQLQGVGWDIGRRHRNKLHQQVS